MSGVSLSSANRQLQLVSAISCLSCLLVVCTTLFRSMRSNIFMRIIACLSLSVMCGNIPYLSVARTEDGSTWCSLQGFFNLYFYPASWVWTTMLICFLYRIAKNCEPFSEFRMHVVGWGTPLVTTLLVLTTNSFGRFGSNDDNDVCTIGGRFETAFLWHIFSYYGLFLACLVVMLVVYVKILQTQYNGTSHVSLEMLKLVLGSLQWYPLFMVVCWAPEIVAFVVQYVADNDKLYHYALIIKLSNGFITSCIFFGKSEQARRSWLQVITGKKYFAIPSKLSIDSEASSDIFAGDFLENGRDPLVKSWHQPLVEDNSQSIRSSEIIK